MEKPANKFRISMNSNKYIFLVVIFSFLSFTVFSQEQDSSQFKKGNTYILGGITTSGLIKFSEQTVKIHSGLVVGQAIKLPGDKLSSALKKLYETKQFSSVNIYFTKIEDSKVYLEIAVIELPQISDVKIIGVSKSKSKSLLKEMNIKVGEMITDNLLVTSKNFVTKEYVDKGYLNTKVNISTLKDTTEVNASKMLILVDKGDKVKIAKIDFDGNSLVKDKKLRKAMKKTKRKFFGRFWKRSKYIGEDFDNDLERVIAKYNSMGYRDAKILSDTIIRNENNTISLKIKVEEGQKYYFGDISFVGNVKYDNKQLQSLLKIRKGDVFDAKILNERVMGDGSPESNDIATLYQNNGYMFSSVTPVETKIINDSIYVEIRIREDKPATISKIEIIGNHKTHDHVIIREIKTLPGQLYNKAAIIRTLRELGQLGYFDAENISPDLSENSYEDKTVAIKYTLEETSASQIELQGGYGGGTFIGTLGLNFKNFSIRNIFNKKSYSPLPMGDGQTLALRLQTSRFYSTYSFSFSEPWLGGKKPQSFSFSIYNSNQYQVDPSTRTVNKNNKMSIVGITLGLGKRLTWPDDFFTLRQSLNFQIYDLNNYSLSVAGKRLTQGTLNNISYEATIGRNSSGPSRIFPKTGSDMSFTFKGTLPYSLFNGVDYSAFDNDDPDNVNPEQYKWLEYYKLSFKSKWYTPLVGKFVMMTNFELGYLGKYNSELEDSPFERYFVGGDGMGTYQLDGREAIALRGYENSSLSSAAGGTIYNKFTIEARFPVTLKPSASIYLLGFFEAGNSYDGFDKFNPFKLKKSAGLGIRIFMPAFGLLGIDFAKGFDPVLGSNTPSGWQTHFIIGSQL